MAVLKPSLDQVKGCIFGLAVGDALGATTEMMNPEGIKRQYGVHMDIIGGGWLHLEPGQVTDDTEMALALANSIIEAQGYDLQAAARRYVEWYNSRPSDMGTTTRTALQKLKRGMSPVSSGVPAPAAANGSAMRCAPIGVVYWNDAQKRAHFSREDSAMTHANPLCISACVLVNELIAKALSGASLLEMQAAGMALPINGEITSTLSQKSPVQSPSGYIIDTLRAVFYALFHHDSFERILISIVNLGGDADTTGAIVGAIAGAYYGFDAIPKRWVDKIIRKRDLENAAKSLYELIERQ